MAFKLLSKFFHFRKQLVWRDKWQAKMKHLILSRIYVYLHLQLLQVQKNARFIWLCIKFYTALEIFEFKKLIFIWLWDKFQKVWKQATGNFTLFIVQLYFLLDRANLIICYDKYHFNSNQSMPRKDCNNLIRRNKIFFHIISRI